MKSAYAIGLSKWQAAKEIIYLVKYTSVAYIIQEPELLAQAKFFASDTFYHLQIYLLISAVYLGLIWIVSKLTDRLEKKLFIPGFDLSHLK